MGTITKDIAIINEPARLSLAALPNFVKFQSKPGAKVFLEINFNILGTPTPETSLIKITEPNGDAHNFTGTLDPDKVGGGVFLISTDKAATAENIRQAFLSVDWVRSNFEIIIPYALAGANISNGETLNIKSKGTGQDYNFILTVPANVGAYSIILINAASVNSDSISGEDVTAEVQLDVYTDLGIKLGQPDAPTSTSAIGRYITSLTKTYAGAPVWFDVSAIFSQYGGYNIPRGTSWLNAGTIKDFRFMAKVKNGVPFYQSGALYVLNGYARLSAGPDMEGYIYTGGTVKLLTSKPRTPYIKGQREYINFILGEMDAPVDIKINYRAYTTGGELLGVFESPVINTVNLSTVNTKALDIDQVLAIYPKAGLIRAALASGTFLISNDLEYMVRPEGLHQRRAFTFLNSLGGWDAFNFDAPVKDEIKPTSETYNKTVTPDYRRGDSVETVYAVNLENTFTVEGSPVTDEVARWLKEFAASTVVLDEDFNYLIKEDFTLIKTAGAFNMQLPIFKYTLSENYTNG